MWKKIGLGLLIAGILVAGGVGAVVAASAVVDDGPIDDMFARMAQRLGLTRETMLQELLEGKSLEDVLEDQGMTRKDLMGDRVIRFVHQPKPPFFDLEAIAAVLGMEAADVQAAFADGQSLAEVIAAQGLDKDDVLADLIAFAEEKIQAAQEAGDITEEQADKLLERLENTDIGTDWMDKVPLQPTVRDRVLGRLKAQPRILLGDIATTLDMEPKELLDALREGQSLGEIIEAQGLEEDAVFEEVKAAILARLEGAIDDQQEALDRAEEMLEKLKAGDFGEEMWDHWLEWEAPHVGEGRPGLPWRAPRLRKP